MFNSPRKNNWKGNLAWISMIGLAFFLHSGIAQGSPRGQVALFTDASPNHVAAKLTVKKPCGVCFRD